eukprot:6298269-Pyramimonas_sp.AAC.1
MEARDSGRCLENNIQFWKPLDSMSDTAYIICAATDYTPSLVDYTGTEVGIERLGCKGIKGPRSGAPLDDARPYKEEGTEKGPGLPKATDKRVNEPVKGQKGSGDVAGREDTENPGMGDRGESLSKIESEEEGEALRGS